MRIVLTGGGTGGHLFPLLSVAKKIKEKASDAEFLFVGSSGKLEETLLKENNIPLKKVSAGKYRRYFSLANFTDFFKVPLGIFQALWLLWKYMPDVIFSKGGYASIPTVVAGWIYRIPILIHESDSVPGMTNSVLGKFADRIAISYPQAEKSFQSFQVLLTGNPLRENINQGDAQKAREKFSLKAEKKVIFIMGGSQGSETINSKIMRILPQLLKKYQVIHQTGEKNFEKVKKEAGEQGIKIGRDGYVILPFVDEALADIYALVDLVISRAGANSLSEIAANKKPALIIPLKNAANDHQRMNAYALSQIGGCVVLEEDNLGENLLLSRIEEILEDAAFAQKLSQNIQSFFHADAAEKIANEILEIAQKKTV
jgi:UDP-N-acetylglucosamine--N-acetylmuramyl-(pentapeptide) pyrophosphoryl-undecaprenol N-acetylglucosamine transferase